MHWEFTNIYTSVHVDNCFPLCATLTQNNERIIFHWYGADLNLSDETHNAEGELSMDCSLFPSNLPVWKSIVFAKL